MLWGVAYAITQILTAVTVASWAPPSSSTTSALRSDRVERVQKLVVDSSADERDAMLRGTAARIYRL